MTAAGFLALILALGAVEMDLRSRRIANVWLAGRVGGRILDTVIPRRKGRRGPLRREVFCLWRCWQFCSGSGCWAPEISNFCLHWEA